MNNEGVVTDPPRYLSCDCGSILVPSFSQVTDEAGEYKEATLQINVTFPLKSPNTSDRVVSSTTSKRNKPYLKLGILFKGHIFVVCYF